MFPASLRPGEWYVAAVCTNCKTLIPLFCDLTEGTSDLKVNYVLTCPQCKTEGAHEAQHYRHPNKEIIKSA